MNNHIISNFQKMIDVNTPIIYIQDYDFVRVDELIGRVVNDKKIFEWNPATGTTDFFTKEQKGLADMQSLEAFLMDKYQEEIASEKYIVLKEIQDFIEEPKIKTLLLLMAQRRLLTRNMIPLSSLSLPSFGYPAKSRNTFLTWK